MEPESPSKNITIDTTFTTPERSLRPGAPVSPTDSFLSPTSVALAHRFRGFTRSDETSSSSKAPESSEESSGNAKEAENPVSMRPVDPEDLVNLSRSIPESVPPTTLPIILGSSSYHRKLALETAGWEFTTMSPDIDEKAIRTPDPVELPRIIAVAKMHEIDRMLEEEAKNSEDGRKREAIVITSDQVTVFNGVVREKPVSEEEAREFLSSYSNDSVATITAVVVQNTQNGKVAIEVDIANVYWNEIPQDVIDELVAKEDVYNCAGSFTLEDPILAPCVRGIEGSVDSVLGLPIDSVLRCIGQVA
jgi:septum formation protein